MPQNTTLWKYRKVANGTTQHETNHMNPQNTNTHQNHKHLEHRWNPKTRTPSNHQQDKQTWQARIQKVKIHDTVVYSFYALGIVLEFMWFEIDLGLL